jgi:4-hydroxybenzoate polyprenyltransferase
MMRRMSLIVGILTVVGVIVALQFNAPWAAVGLPVGVAITVFNLRLMDKQVARVVISDPDDKKEKKAARNQIGRSSALRLALMSSAVIISLIIAPKFCLGVVSGLAISQLVFLVSAYGVVAGNRTWN